MIGIEQLSFDPTDSDSIEASHSVGAYVRAGTDGDLIGSETLNSLEWLRTAGPIIDSSGNEVAVTGNALDVNIASGSLTVTESDVYAEDSAHTTGDDGTFVMAVRVDDLAAVPATALAGTELDYQAFISGPNGELLVGAVDLDIRDLDAATDNVAAWLADGAGTALTSTLVGADQSLDVNLTQSVVLSVDDNGGSLTVDATDLDIRSLDHTSGGANDSVRLGDGTDFITSTLVGSDQALDVYVANDIVANDTADTAILNTQKDVTTTGALLASQLANRKYLYVQNLGGNSIYIGASGVTSGTGIHMSRGALAEFRLGPSLSLHAVASAGTVDTRLMELS